MTDIQKIQKCIDDSNWPNLLKAMFILTYWIIQKITASQCTLFCAQVGYTFDSSAVTLSDGTTTYSIYQALDLACDTIYPQKVALGAPLMSSIIGAAKDEGYLTDADHPNADANYAALVAKL